jgi:hypothetical protein
MRLLRHLSFSNVIAMLALFVALGGAAYAGTTINGSSIKNGSIGGGKLKTETITANKLKKGTLTGTQIANQSITGAQIQNGSIDASQINVSTLGAVPLAQAAQTATKAASATKASTADSATTADTATNADNATHADSATNADAAAEAEKFGGKTAGELRAEFEVSCPSATEFYGGMCWDQTTRPPRLWLVAVRECGEAGGRLPTIEELIAFVLQDGVQVNAQTWSGDIDSLAGGPKEEMVFSSDENGRSTANGSLLGGLLGYRCVFPQSN